MVKQSYLLELLDDHAKFEAAEWKTFVYTQINELDAIQKDYLEKLDCIDLLEKENKQLHDYIKVLERQLDLAKKLIETSELFEFPLYKKEESEQEAKQWQSLKNTTG